MAEVQPVRLLIAALGGEGGGVLAAWITEAAAASGLVVSRTSIPGVAQRTGATTYYIETVRASGSAVPILGLNPAPGQVDILLATELLEAARMVHAGFITPARTLVIAADHRVYATDEKVAMGDGRTSEDQLRDTLKRFSKRLVLTDLAAVAADSRSPLNVVVLGVLAGLKVLPIMADTFRATIRAEGKAIEANLRGFEAGLAVVTESPSPRASRTSQQTASARGEGHGGAVPPARGEGQQQSPTPPASAPHPSPLPVKNGERGFPAEAQAVLREGIARLTDYQNEAYAKQYLARVKRIAGHPRADGELVRELARHLAVRMSVEDVIRVA